LAVDTPTEKQRAAGESEPTNDLSGIDDAGSPPSVVRLLMFVFVILIGGGLVIGALAVVGLAGWL
jgi:hypothetical protein